MLVRLRPRARLYHTAPSKLARYSS